MRPDFDPALMTVDERRHEVVSILAMGLRRLRDRAALLPTTAPENSSNSQANGLEAVPQNPLTDHVG